MSDPSDPAAARVVLVLGASSGIGLATAVQFARAGARVVLGARSPESLDAAASQCRDAGAGQVDTVVVDVADQEQVRAAVDRTVALHGRLDVALLTAAVMAYGTVEDVPPQVFDRVVDIAIRGTANTARAVLPVLRRQGRGTIIVVNSLLGAATVPELGAYATAKWGQRALVRTLQQELRPEPGIHICLVGPGSVNTPIYYQAANYLGRALRPPWPVRQPERVAEIVARLADHPRRYVSVPVGVTNPLIITGFRLLPFVYDRIVKGAFQLASVRKQEVPATSGNVERPRPDRERIRGDSPPPSPTDPAGPG